METAIQHGKFDNDGNFTLEIPSGKKSALEVADMYFQFGNLFTELGSAEGEAKPSEPEVKGVNLYDPDNRTTISQMSLEANMES